MHFKASSSHCSFHLFVNILWDGLKASAAPAGTSRLPNNGTEGVAPHLVFSLYVRSYQKECLRKAVL